MRAKPSGIKLTDAQAAIVKGMLARGDRQHDIASYFGVNGGRIAEISTEAKFPHVKAQHTDLPAPGPYMNQVDVESVKDRLRELLQDLESKSYGRK